MTATPLKGTLEHFGDLPKQITDDITPARKASAVPLPWILATNGT
jgi:hypothetical protein